MLVWVHFFAPSWHVRRILLDLSAHCMITGQDYAAVAVLSAEDERCHSPETPGCAEGCLVLMSVYDLSEQHGRVRVSVPHFTVLMGQGGAAS